MIKQRRAPNRVCKQRTAERYGEFVKLNVKQDIETRAGRNFYATTNDSQLILGRKLIYLEVSQHANV